MSDQRSGSGWQPLSRGSVPEASTPKATAEAPRRLNPDGSLIVSPFVRLARTHAFHAAGEASVLVTFAGTLLSIDPNDARSRILLALVLTMAPFAVVGPLIGPALDRMRGGRKLTITLSLVLRAALMVLLIRNVGTNWFFPIAFTWLVLGKTYSVAKAATVPTTVADEEELVDKNSRLAILTAVAGGLGVIPAAGLYRLFDATPTLVLAAIFYVVGAAASVRLPRVVVDDPATHDDDLEIRSSGVRLAAIVMATIRGIVGFVFFLLLFEFVRSELPDLSGMGTAVGAAVKYSMGFDLLEDPGLPWWQAAIPFALWGVGGFAGNVIAPWFRRKFSEETMIMGSVAAICVAAVFAVWAGGMSGASLVALIVGGCASAAKLAFDALVQRDAPGANHGAAFGRFETRFQIAWVIGSLVAVIVPIPLRAGFLIIALAAVAVAVVVMQQGSVNGLSFGGAPRLPAMPGRRHRASAPDPGTSPDGAGVASHEAAQQPTGEVLSAQQMTTHQAAAPQAPVRDQATPLPTSHTGGAADPYAAAFADRPVDPPDWAAAVFDDENDGPGVYRPEWIDDDPTPTPPLGTEPIDPNL